LSVSIIDLEKQLKAVTKTGKYLVGRKEVRNGLRGSKLLVWSASAGIPPKILEEARSLQVPAVRFDGNPIELGRTCGIPYKVSVIAVKSAGEANLGSFEKSVDYATKSGILAQQTASEVILPVESQSGERKQKEGGQTRKSVAKKKATKKSAESVKSSTGKVKEEGETGEKEQAPKKVSRRKTKKTKENEEAQREADAEESTDEEE
jgi:large subunit ribosomal protein L30e